MSTRYVNPVDSRTGRLQGSLVMTIPRSDRVSTENGWKSVLLENVNCVNLNCFRLERLIPKEHDLRYPLRYPDSRYGYGPRSPVPGTGRITRTRTRLHGKPIKLKIHRVTPGTICAKMKGLYRVLIAFFFSYLQYATNMPSTQKWNKPRLLLSKNSNQEVSFQVSIKYVFEFSYFSSWFMTCCILNLFKCVQAKIS